MKLSPAGGVALLLLLAGNSGTAQGAGIVGSQRPHPAHHQPPHHGVLMSSSHAGGDNPPSQLFPLLTKLRDSVIELFYGRHPAKDANSRLPSSPWNPRRSRYANELVLRFNISTAEEEAALAEASARFFLDIWAFTSDFVDIRLRTDIIAPLLSLLPESLQTSHSVLIPDLAAVVYKSHPISGPGDSRSQLVQPDRSVPLLLKDTPQTSRVDDNFFFQDFQPLDVIIRWMQLLEAMFPSFVDYITVGKSFEGREIPALRIRTPAGAPSGRPRRTIVITGGLHGREWISTSTVNYVAWSYISSYGKDPLITRFLNHYDMVFMPVINPDGFEYTWQVDRLWRKSRQSTNLRFCPGIDLDHAFGFGWNTAPTQNEPCSGSYGGERPFEAVEAVQLANWARNETQNGVKFMGLLDLHSYSQQVLFPYSYTCDAEPPNLESLEELAAGLAKAIRLSNGESYSVTSACQGAVTAAAHSRRNSVWPRIESGGGSAIDWFYHELGAHYSYQIKLRDTGSYGFLLPKEYIVPTGEEMLEAIKYFGDFLLGNNGIEKAIMDNQDDGVKVEDAEEAHLSQELRRRRLMKA